MTLPVVAVSRPTDPGEREAERVADSLSDGRRGCDESARCRTGADASLVHRAAVSASPRPAAPVEVPAGGRTLDASVRAWFEPRLGASLGAVRIHTDGSAAEAARRLRARAFTVGEDIGFGAGEYAPETAAGHRLLAHELAHIVQQPSGRGPAQGLPVVQRFESYEHVELGDVASGSPGGGFIILEAHRRDLPGHASPTTGWPPEWVSLWSRGTPEQQRAIRDGLTYGEVVALAGDLYAAVDSKGTTDIAQSVERLNHASLREIWDLIPLIHSRSTTTAELEEATGGRYMTLAKENISHFSNVPAGQRNIDVWRDGHAAAIRLARAGQTNEAWMTSAASDHFLTDAFSGGHLREARAQLVASAPGQVRAKIEHDLDNKFGVAVVNRRGDRWTAYGDSYLDDRADTRNRSFALEAVTLAKADIAAALSQRSAYPDPPTPVPEGTFAAEAIVPQPVNVNATTWGWTDYVAEAADLAATELPEQLTPNDTRIRNWIMRQPPAAIRDVPIDEKLRMVNRLLDGWVSDEDLDAVERLYINSSDADMHEIGRAITPRISSLTDIGQRTRLRVLLARTQ
jgi:uncharacterized protein DUF4157